MNLKNLHSVYFIGIGGIGMSALARYFRLQGIAVSGYDRVKNSICTELENQNIQIHYNDEVSEIPGDFLQTPKDNALVVYTPAVPKNLRVLNYLKDEEYQVIKRSVALGKVVENYRTIAVAGTHGKTTTSALIAHLLTESGIGCTAFLGGVSTNYNSNFISDAASAYVVVEADEYDRSFLTLHPEYAVVTSIETDHLDIYGSDEQLLDSFRQFVKQIKPDGMLFLSDGVSGLQHFGTCVKYGLKPGADLSAEHIQINAGEYSFDLKYQGGELKKLNLGLPGRHNVENALAAVGVALALQADPVAIRKALQSFKGVRRRFEVHVKNESRIFIDDYAHHPSEIAAFVSSVREMYPAKKLTGVFQPHLYSRTRDLAEDFGSALSLLDEVILLDIYPAREEPIEGVESGMLLKHIKLVSKEVCAKADLLSRVRNQPPEVLLTMGAGDIDQLVEPLKAAMQ